MRTVAVISQKGGAGKTTLLRIIAGLGKATKGSVRVLGQNVREENARRRIGVASPGWVGRPCWFMGISLAKG